MPDTCPATHPVTGRTCELMKGHLGEHMTTGHGTYPLFWGYKEIADA